MCQGILVPRNIYILFLAHADAHAKLKGNHAHLEASTAARIQFDFELVFEIERFGDKGRVVRIIRVVSEGLLDLTLW